jgi:hypothetical protein
MKTTDSYMINQVFSVVIIALLGITFYVVAVDNLASGGANGLVPLVLIIIAITCLAILSELSKITLTLSKKK